MGRAERGDEAGGGVMLARVGGILHTVGAAWLLAWLWHFHQRSRVRVVDLGIGRFRSPLYEPWLYLLMGMCVLVLAWRLTALARWIRSRRSPGSERSSPLAPDPEPVSSSAPGPEAGGMPEGPPARLAWIDLGLASILTLGSWRLLEAFRLKQNPDGVLLGSDYVTFLSNIVAVAFERWDLYNADKRIVYPWLAATWARVSDRSFLEAGQDMSMLSVVLLPLATYLLALPVMGRLTALLAAVLVISMPALHSFAVNTGSYSMFFLGATLTGAAAVWALTRGSAWLYLLYGVTAAITIQIDVKGQTITWALTGLLALFTLRRGFAAFLRRGAAMAAPLLLMSPLVDRLPMVNTGFASLIATQRVETHREIGYPLAPARNHADLRYPSPISRWLPGWLRGGELEELASVLSTPPQDEVVVFRRHNQNGRMVSEPEIKRDSNIPPLRVILTANLEDLRRLVAKLDVVLVALLGLGLVALLFPLPRGLPATRRATAWLIFGVLLSVWGPLSLKFRLRYFLHELPVLCILVVHGTQALVQQGVGNRRPGWRLTQQALVVWFVGCLAVSLLLQSNREWLNPFGPAPDLEARMLRLPPEAGIAQGTAVKQVGDWLEAHAPADARIFDASTVQVWLMAPEDTRFVVPSFGTWTWQDLARQLEAGASPRPTFVVVSDIPEFQFDAAPTPARLLEQPDRWTLVYGLELPALTPVTRVEAITKGSSHLLVFQEKTSAAPTEAGPATSPLAPPH